MRTEGAFPAREDFIIEAAIEHLLGLVDLNFEFDREGLLDDLKSHRDNPCPTWVKEFKERYDPYPLSMIESAYRQACGELIEYFSEE